MAVNLDKDKNVPTDIPEGLIGFFESAKKTQWLFHPASIQIMYARVDFDTFNSFLGETLSTPSLGWHPYTQEYHSVIMGLAGLQVPQLGEDDDDPYAFDYDGPHAFTADPPLTLRGALSDEQELKVYGIGASLLKKKSGDYKAEDSTKDHTWKDVVTLWDYGKQLSFEGTNTKRKRAQFDPTTAFVQSAEEPAMPGEDVPMQSSNSPEPDVPMQSSSSAGPDSQAAASKSRPAPSPSGGTIRMAPDPQAAASKSCPAPSPTSAPRGPDDDRCFYHWTGLKCGKNACAQIKMLSKRASPKYRWVCADHRDKFVVADKVANVV